MKPDPRTHPRKNLEMNASQSLLAGICAKIVGGSVTDKPENMHGGAAAMKKG